MENSTTSDWQNKKILIVDNDVDSVFMLAQLLEFHGIAVTAAESGRIALDALDKDHYFCVLTDLQMPGITGWDILNAIRQHADPQIRNTPIIAVTGRALVRDRSQIIEAGFNGYIVKPIYPSTLLETIKSIVDRPSQ